MCRIHRINPSIHKIIRKIEIIFNRELSIDLLWPSHKPVLHIADMETGFQNEIYIRNRTAENLWKESKLCLAENYTGFAEAIRLHTETRFTSSTLEKDRKRGSRTMTQLSRS